jgi:hypothetical protein
MMTALEMRVKDKFSLSNGRTIFTGEVSGNWNKIKPYKCDVVLGAGKIGELNIFPEIPLRLKDGSLKGVSTSDLLELKNIDPSEILLKFKI